MTDTRGGKDEARVVDRLDHIVFLMYCQLGALGFIIGVLLSRSSS